MEKIAKIRFVCMVNYLENAERNLKLLLAAIPRT